MSAFPLALGTDRAPPSEFRIFRKGENRSEKGTFVFDDTSALSVMREYASHNKPMRFDYNHGTLLEAPPTPEAALSAGTFVPEIRDGELWATKCSWTPRASKLVSDGEYGEFSPYFDHTKTGVITRLINCALTNLPALDDIESLVAASATRTEEPSVETCTACTALNTRLSAMDEECKALKVKLSAFEEKDKDDSTKATALKAVTGQETLAAALGTVAGWKQKAEGYDKLAADTAEREATSLRAEMTSVLDEGAKALKVTGKPGETGTQRAVFEQGALAMGAGKPSKEGIAWLKAAIAAAPVALNGAPTAQKPSGGAPPTVIGKELDKTMGIDGVKFAEWQAKQLAAGATG